MLSAWRTRRLSLHRSASTVKVERPGSPVSLTTESDESSDDDDDSDAFYDAAEPIDERLPSFFLPRRSTFRRNVWTTDSIDIGVTSVVPSQSHTFEISLLFPHAGRLWKVQRRLSEFAALHTALEASYGTAMQERGIHLPRAPRLGWGNNATADDPAALHMMLKLNTYLRKLVEVNDIVDDSVFREFLTPRPLSRTDVEVRSKTLPSLETTHSARHAMTEILNMKSCPSVQLNENAKAVDSLCDQAIHFGSGIQLRALGGLRVGLTKRGGLSGSHKIAAVAAGLAGMALTGPLSAAFALGAVGGGMGKYQMNKNFYLTLNKPRNHAFRSSGSTSTVQDGNSHANGWFVVENAELVTGPRRAVKYGDLIHLYCRNLRKNVALGQPPDSRHGHLMVANQDTKRTTLRLVSPYGHKGEIVCGSQVYLQVLDGQWSGQYMSLQGDAIATGNSPAMFKICQQYHACAASEDTITVPRTLTQQQLEDLPPFKLRVMVYNVWLFPSILTALNDSICPSTMQRAQAIPQCLGALDVDVVVFCEAFCSTAREILIKGMKEQGFLYETKVVGEGASVTTKKAIDGGCFAMSKYPMERFEELTFGSMAVGDDRMSDKGVIYFQVRVPQGETVHVFGTHLQAWETKVAIAARKNQLRALREFIDSKQIPPQDAVIVAGDLNVDQCGEDIKEYEEMLELLDANDVQLAKSSSPYSFDPLTNKLAVSGLSSGGHTERLDYILSTRNHRQPTRSEAQIVQLKATQHWTVPSDALKAEHLVDLSDHYPVVADFQF